jgi:hypothetical protein
VVPCGPVPSPRRRAVGQRRGQELLLVYADVRQVRAPERCCCGLLRVAVECYDLAEALRESSRERAVPAPDVQAAAPLGGSSRSSRRWWWVLWFHAVPTGPR